MYGIAQKVGLDVSELKVILVGDEHPSRLSKPSMIRLNGTMLH